MVQGKFEVQHLKENMTDTWNRVIFNGTLQIAHDKHRENWIVPDCMNDVLLRIHCHFKESLSVIYVGKNANVQGVQLSVCSVTKQSRIAPM